MKKKSWPRPRRWYFFTFFFYTLPLLYVINGHCRRTCSSTSEIIAAAAQSHSISRPQSCQPRWLSPFKWNNHSFLNLLASNYWDYARGIPREERKRERTRDWDVSPRRHQKCAFLKFICFLTTLGVLFRSHPLCWPDNGLHRSISRSPKRYRFGQNTNKCAAQRHFEEWSACCLWGKSIAAASYNWLFVAAPPFVFLRSLDMK